MKVTYQEFGGFAPVHRVCTLDTDEMPAVEATKLRSMISESGVTSLADIRLPGNDLGQVSIRIEGEGIDHSVTLDTAATPDRLLPLVNYLRARAHDFHGDRPASQ